MEIEYVDSAHLYLADGVIIPSVTQIIEKLFPATYENVPPDVLKKAAEFGTKIHETVAWWHGRAEAPKLGPLELEILNGYKKIERENKIEVSQMEKIIHFNGRYAGRFDMLGWIGGEYSLADIKTTAKVEIDRLKWQLGLYKMAYENMTGEKIKSCYCIWLPKKNPAKLIAIEPVNERRCLDVLEKIEKGESVRI